MVKDRSADKPQSLLEIANRARLRAFQAWLASNIPNLLIVPHVARRALELILTVRDAEVETVKTGFTGLGIASGLSESQRSINSAAIRGLVW